MGPIILTICGAIVLVTMILTADTCSTTETKDVSAATQMFNNCVTATNDVFECGRRAEELVVTKTEKVCK